MSGSADDSTKELTEKLKKLMKSPDFPGNVIADAEARHHLQLPPALMQQMGKENTNTQSRLQAIRQLTVTCTEKVIKEDQVEQLWLVLEDLLAPGGGESLAAALRLITAVAVTSNASKRLGGPMRHIILNYVSTNSSKILIEPMFDLFSGALGDGKMLVLVEDLVGPFFNSWYPKLLASKRAEAAIELFINLIKTNAAFLDETELLGLVKQTVHHINHTSSVKEGVQCLQAIDTVVAYCHLPSVMKFSVIATLGKVVSSPAHTERAWKLMRTILGTYIGVAAYYTLVDIIRSKDVTDHHITRGCVYFLHMALWGNNPVTTLDIPYHLALPVLLEVSEHPNELVVYEVSFAMKLLVAKLGPEIHPQAWESIFIIVSNLYKYSIIMNDNTKAQAVLNVVNDTVDYMEQLRDQDQFCVMREIFYTFLSPFTLLRTEASTLKVLEHLIAACVERHKEAGWLESLGRLLHQYYVRDTRLAVRVAAVNWMRECIDALGKKQGTQLIAEVILPAVHEYREEPLLGVRCAVVDLLGHIIHKHNHPIITDCLHLLLRTVTEPFKQDYGDTTREFTCGEAADVGLAVSWFIKIFKRRMWTLPSTDAITAFRALLNFLESHYNNPVLFRSMSCTRAQIFDMIFHLRANSRYEIGLPEVEDAQLGYNKKPVPGISYVNRPKYSAYIIIDHKHGQTLANAANTASNSPADTVRTSSNSASSTPGSAANLSLSSPFVRRYSGATTIAGVGESTSDADADTASDVLAGGGETGTEGNDAAAAALSEVTSDKAVNEYLAHVVGKNYGASGGRPPPLPKTDDPWREAQRHATITYLSLTEAAATVIVALKKEKDWTILKMILEGIPKMLQNKALIVSRDSNDIDYFADALTGVISDRSTKLGELYNTPEKFLRPDFELYVFLALSCLSCYRKQLSFKWQNAVVACLTAGMMSKCGGVCIAALTLCCLEMPQTMVRSLPSILHSLTKISATVHSSQPVLEFLSTLLHLPHIYSNFSSEQYMAVFAIVIPFTNPVKFNQYVVILSFHVLAMWFLKCKLSSRRNFVNFITKNLKNVLPPESSVTRRRSTEQNVAGDRSEIYATLHQDMRMILTDLMSRYAFASCAPMARRSEVGEALVGSGQQQTWLVGLKLFTITTSGCSQRPMTQDGLCENCQAACAHLIQAEDPSKTQEGSDDTVLSDASGQSVSHATANSGASGQDTADSAAGAIKDGAAALRENHLCTCWCVGYSEVYVRQPTGNMVWMMRLQNQQQILEEGKQMSLDDLATLYGPNVTPKIGQLGTVLSAMQSRQSAEELSCMTMSPGSDALEGRRRSSSSAATTPTTRLRGASGGVDNAARPVLLTGAVIGGGPPQSLREEEDAVETRAAVQRSQSNPEIGDGETALPSASSDDHPRHSSGGSVAFAPPSDNSSVRSAAAAASPPPNKATSPTVVPPSPSKSFFRFGSKFNTNINKLFGNPSSSSSGSTSPTIIDQQQAQLSNSGSISSGGGDSKRLRHSSALTPSNTSSSQPNVSAANTGAVQRLPSSHDGADCDSLAPIRRGRGHTISVMNPASRPPPPTLGTPLSPLGSTAPPTITQPRLQEIFSKPWSRPQPGTTTHGSAKSSGGSGNKGRERRGGVTPSNVVLQLLYSGNLEKSFERPLLLPMEQDEFKRTIDVLDHTPPVENHKIGVLYVADGQTTEQEILSNTNGSVRYQKFLQGIGTCVSLKKASKGFIHCLSDKGDDGDECYVWQDEIMQVVFHVATVMPNKPNDPKFSYKKKHIGNDFVTIVYNDSGKPYDRDTIKTQFNTVIVEIRPTDHETNTVHIVLKPKIQDLLSLSPVVRLVSDANLALYARQMALHSVIACRVQQQLLTPEPYAGNWLHRLRSTYRLRKRLLERLRQEEKDETIDFTDMLESR